MNVSLGVTLTSAPPVSPLLSAGLVNPDNPAPANPEARPFEALLAAYAVALDATAEAAVADLPLRTDLPAEPPADEATSAQLLTLMALLGQMPALVPATDPLPVLVEPPASGAITPAVSGPLGQPAAALWPDLAVAAPLLPANLTPAATGDAPADLAGQPIPAAFAAALSQVLADEPPATAAEISAPLTTEPGTASASTASTMSSPAIAADRLPAATPVRPAPETPAPEALPVTPGAQPLATGAPVAAPDLPAGVTVTPAAAHDLNIPREARTLAQPDPLTPDAAPTVVGTGAVAAYTDPLNAVEPARLSEARPLSTPALAPETLAALTPALVRLAKSGDSEMRLQLRPESLGRIDLHITHHADGVRVMLVAEVAATAGLLDQHLNDLRQALTTAGVTLTGLAVGDGSAQQAATGSQTGQGAGYQPPASGAHLPPDRSAEPTPHQPGRPAGLVDYWI